MLVGALYFASPFLLVILGWWQEPFSELGGAERVSHRVHEVLFGLIFAQAMTGAVSQLRRPREWPAGMLQTVAAVAGFVATLAMIGRFELLGIGFLLLGLSAAVLHPAGVALWRNWRPQPLAVVVALTGLPPWLSLAADNMVKAGNQAADHLTHWGGVAAFAVVQILLSLLAALRPPGYRLVAGSVGLAGVAYLGASTLFDFDASAKPGVFAFWLFLWAVTWLVVAFRSGAKAAGSVRRPAGALPQLTRAALTTVFVLVLVIPALVAAETGQTNIPHGLPVSYALADVSTCLDCHATGVNGATVIPHEVTRTCGADFEFCWDGRSDCMGCHRYDPDLSRIQVMLPRAGFSPTVFVGGRAVDVVRVKSLLRRES